MKNGFAWRVLAAAVAVWSSSSHVAWAQNQDALFNNDGQLQEIRLRVSPRDWETLKETADLDTYYPADLTWKGLTVRNIGIRSRGNTTRNGIKPGLRVDFNRYLSNQEFLGLKALALDNAWSDASLMREWMAMKVFTRMGLTAPRESHARVYINDEYAGLYVMIEAIDRPFIARTFGAPEADLERGGYLFEYNWVRPYTFEYLGPGLAAYVELFAPETRETDSIVGVYEPIEEMIRVINESPDDRFLADLGEHLDVKQFIRYLAVENFLGETDGLLSEWGLHNFFLYRFRDGRAAQLIPWDKDYTFSQPNHPINYHIATNVLTKRALAIPELAQLYVDTLMECASVAEEADPNDPRGWLERSIDQEAGRIVSAAAEDPVMPFSFAQFESDVEFLRQFARTRSQQVRCQANRQSCPTAVSRTPNARRRRDASSLR